MIHYPTCKINLGLNIIAKRSDGFHELETIFYPLALQDMLEIIPVKSSTELTVTGMLDIGDFKQNLVYKAYILLKEKYNLPPVQMHLHKLIPAGAGLGGGSADAAFTIKLLDELFQLKISVHEQLNFAARLGSDCSFFILNYPALATGRGNLCAPIELSLNGYFIYLIKPPVHISTAEAYAGVSPRVQTQSLAITIKQPISIWKDTIHNQFEESIFPKYPLLQEIKNYFYNQGATYAAMSGSGSTVFGIFNELPDIKKETFSNDTFYWCGEL